MVAHAPRKCKYLATVVKGYPRGNDSSAMGSRLHEDARIRHSSHDAVAPHEVALVGICACHKFREQSTVIYHLASHVLVGSGIEIIESVSHHAHCVISHGKSLLMGIDINTIGQSAHHQHLGTEHLEVA